MIFHFNFTFLLVKRTAPFTVHILEMKQLSLRFLQLKVIISIFH